MFFIALIKFRKKARDVVEIGKKVMQILCVGVKVAIVVVTSKVIANFGSEILNS